ncbi:MAG TPA: methyltransferase domain-containing protein [Vicinamibacteria bacterium]|nr:methyltransferase domain-containing protein [Vicinamibacteria bacterium]
MNSEFEGLREFWNRIAQDWQIQVGREGDANRRLNSDPVLWHFAGDVRGLKVLDAGCGTGYLSIQLAERGARVTGIDFSERMIAIARATDPAGDFRVDSCSELSTVEDEEFDLIVANYVLMDTPDLRGAVQAFHRVLKPGGLAVLVFSHPCFPAGRAHERDDGGVSYVWDFPYFQRQRCTDPPWGHFTSDFIWFHRPLSDYWKAFIDAGFAVVDFEEPRITEDRYHLIEKEESLKRSQFCPYSVAFKLKKGSPTERPSHESGPA